jgi:hypothetical protein
MSRRLPADRIDGTQRPTNRPRSRSPENQSQIERAKEMKAAAKNKALEVAMAVRESRRVVESV